MPKRETKIERVRAHGITRMILDDQNAATRPRIKAKSDCLTNITGRSEACASRLAGRFAMDADQLRCRKNCHRSLVPGSRLPAWKRTLSRNIDAAGAQQKKTTAAAIGGGKRLSPSSRPLHQEKPSKKAGGTPNRMAVQTTSPRCPGQCRQRRLPEGTATKVPIPKSNPGMIAKCDRSHI